MRSVMASKSLLVLLGIVLVVLVYIVMPKNTPSPAYTVVEQLGDIEIREYEPYILAQVQVTGDRREAIQKGFRMLADYIFGNNVGNDSISMTVPVVQSSGQKIDMTAPVVQQGDGQRWTIAFIMPPSYKDIASLPKPVNEEVKFKAMDVRHVAALKFKGASKTQLLEKKSLKLLEGLEAANVNIVGVPEYAFYDPPWVLPMLKRNEVMVEIKK